MPSNSITFVVNGHTYQLNTTDSEAISEMPRVDRQQLIELLEVVKHQEQVDRAIVRQAINKNSSVTSNISTQDIEPAHLKAHNADDVMARLVLEEKSQQKSELTKTSVYKWVGGLIILIFLAVLVF